MKSLKISFNVHLQKGNYLLPEFAKGNEEIETLFKTLQDIPNITSPMDQMCTEVFAATNYYKKINALIKKKLYSVVIENVKTETEVNDNDTSFISVLCKTDTYEKVEEIKEIFSGIGIAVISKNDENDFEVDCTN
jgi:hypothetical protein